MQIALDDDKNVRNGLFGTALRDDKDVKFKVSFGYVQRLVYCDNGRTLRLAARGLT